MLILSAKPFRLAVVQIRDTDNIPVWATADQGFFSITRTADELSIVCLEDNVPQGVKAEKNWRCIKVEGPLDFSLTGVLASLAQPLAEAKISIFAISTYDTDYILVKEETLAGALDILGSFCEIR